MTVGKVKDFSFSSGGMIKGYAKGGKVTPAPAMGMIKNRGTLGVVGNKNPGETRMNTAPNLPGDKMMMNKGGMHKMPNGKMMPDTKMMSKGSKMMSKGGKMGSNNC